MICHMLNAEEKLSIATAKSYLEKEKSICFNRNIEDVKVQRRESVKEIWPKDTVEQNEQIHCCYPRFWRKNRRPFGHFGPKWTDGWIQTIEEPWIPNDRSRPQRDENWIPPYGTMKASN